MCAVFSDLRYVAVAPGVIREDMVSGSQKVGNLTVGEEFLALEEDGNRVKMERYATIPAAFRAGPAFLPADFEDLLAPVCLHPQSVPGRLLCLLVLVPVLVPVHTERAPEVCCAVGVAGAG